MDLSGQTVAILGAGASGFAAAELARARGAEFVCVYDSGDANKLSARTQVFADIGVDTVFGNDALTPPSDLDLTVISPGIDAGWPIGKAFSKTGAPLIGEIEFAWQAGQDTPVIAITGTNGKTTTTELTASILNEAGLKAVAAGNVGTAYSEVIQSKCDYDVIVVEVSSFQLETITSFKPSVAVWMNFAADHMDRYTSLEDYRNAKLRIFENQTANDFSVVKAEEEIAPRSQTVTFSSFNGDADFTYDDGSIFNRGSRILDYRTTLLNGKHNAENVMAAMASANCHGVGFEAMETAIRKFKAPPHRCEVVGKVSDVTFVNDSKATNLHALESSLRGQEGRVILIVGGKNKGLDYNEITGIVSESADRVICIGEMREAIFEAWKDAAHCELAETLEEAVAAASRAAKPGQVVLFSPGTSSFDMFSSYGERGDAFRRAVSNLN